MYTIYMYTLFLLLDFGCAQIFEDSHQGYCMRGDTKAGIVHYNLPEVSTYSVCLCYKAYLLFICN